MARGPARSSDAARRASRSRTGPRLSGVSSAARNGICEGNVPRASGPRRVLTRAGSSPSRRDRSRGRSPSHAVATRVEHRRAPASGLLEADRDRPVGRADGHRSARSDEPGEEFVREKASAGGQDDPIVIDRRRGVRPPAPTRTRRQEAGCGCRQRYATNRSQAEVLASAAAVAGSMASEPPCGKLTIPPSGGASAAR